MNKKYFVVLFLFLFTLISCVAKKPFYVKDVAPPNIISENVLQTSIGYPPLYRPQGKRRTVEPDSQFFTLAIPNSVDVSGRAHDLRRSLADMLYTELYKLLRFNLYDRAELIDLDLSTSLKQSALESPEKTREYFEHSKAKYDSLVAKLQKKADGLLLVYITSRSGAISKKNKGGSFDIDFRIVSTAKEKKIVLFAGKATIRYKSGSKNEVNYYRDDIVKIAKSIVERFPRPEHVQDVHVISVDQNRIVLDVGKNKDIIAGLRGYVINIEDGIYTQNNVKAQHYTYLAKFQITEVYDKTCTAIILDEGNSKNPVHDIKVGDAIILK